MLHLQTSPPDIQNLQGQEPAPDLRSVNRRANLDPLPMGRANPAILARTNRAARILNFGQDIAAQRRELDQRRLAAAEKRGQDLKKRQDFSAKSYQDFMEKYQAPFEKTANNNPLIRSGLKRPYSDSSPSSPNGFLGLFEKAHPGVVNQFTEDLLEQAVGSPEKNAADDLRNLHLDQQYQKERLRGRP